MAKQLEMDLNDPKHPVYVAAKKALDIADQIRDLTQKKTDAFDELAGVFEEHQKYSITIQGVTLIHRKKEMSRGIQIIRPK